MARAVGVFLEVFHLWFHSCFGSAVFPITASLYPSKLEPRTVHYLLKKLERMSLKSEALYVCEDLTEISTCVRLYYVSAEQ